VVNPLVRELVFKIVYYGPGLGGKTTTLQFIHAETRPEHRGKMVSLATPVDRTLYFDYLPIRVPDVRDLAVRLQLFTVPGQVYYNATRKLVLTGADGVVFVADSQRLRAEANLESYDNLRDNLEEHGRELDEMPHIVQLNKRDLPDVLSIEELSQSVNRHQAPQFATVATRGEGVFESLEAITRLVIEDFVKSVPDASGSEMGRLELPEGGLADALRKAEGPTLPRVPTPLPPRFRPSGVHGLGLPKNTTGEVAARVLSGEEARTSQDRDQPPESMPDSTLERELDRAASGSEAKAGEAEAVASNEADPVVEPTFELRRVVEAADPESSRSSSVAAQPPASKTEISGEPAPASSPPPLTGQGAQGAGTPPLAADHVDSDLSSSASSGRFSFAPLWNGSERATVVEVEAALCEGDAVRVASGCEMLVSRSLAAVGGVLGATTEAPRDPATVCLLLGLDGRRYLEFRAAVRDVRSGRRKGPRELMALYAFAIDVRLARIRAVG